MGELECRLELVKGRFVREHRLDLEAKLFHRHLPGLRFRFLCPEPALGGQAGTPLRDPVLIFGNARGLGSAQARCGR